MTPNQRIKLMTDLWPTAARANGWDPRDRARRLAIINEVLAKHPNPARRRIIESASELDSNTDYTLIKNRFLMLADSLDAAREDGDITANSLRQRREVIRNLVKQLAEHLTISSPSREPSDRGGLSSSTAAGGASVLASRPMRTMRAEHYTLKIIHDTTARAGFEPDCFARGTFEQVLSALNLPELDRLIMTLKKRLHRKRLAQHLPA
jgi:hypothetical protein